MNARAAGGDFITKGIDKCTVLTRGPLFVHDPLDELVYALIIAPAGRFTRIPIDSDSVFVVLLLNTCAIGCTGDLVVGEIRWRLKTGRIRTTIRIEPIALIPPIGSR